MNNRTMQILQNTSIPNSIYIIKFNNLKILGVGNNTLCDEKIGVSI